MIFKGRTWVFGHNIDTDGIIPARYLNTTKPEELAYHCMEDVDINFSRNVKPGDIIVAGRNFGCGSSREHAPIAIKASGVECVIASSFARIFYRNSINIGLYILECPEAIEGIGDGDTIEVDTESGIIKNLSIGKFFKANTFPTFIKDIIQAGGLLNYASIGGGYAV
jgi:3-isopropylmalate/(R)-2-methylmalate dehydratase small subunit